MPKEAQPHVRSARILAILILFSAGLVAFSRYQSSRDANLFTKAPSPEQEQFFVAASERPDALPVFERLTPSQRIRAAHNIGEYPRAETAKLAAVLLDSFDPEARKALTESLAKIGQTHPEHVAQQLDKTSSFQTTGVFAALRASEAAAIPLVAKLLESVSHRSNAARWLQEMGKPAIPALVAMLRSGRFDAQVAAAEVLGKLRAREAVAPLESLIDRTEVSKRDPLVGALLVIGDPKTEIVARGILMNPSSPRPLRQQAALCLGRIGTASAVEELVQWRNVEDEELAASVWNALKEAGDKALRAPGLHLSERIQLAKSARSALADQVLREGFRSSYRADRMAALWASIGRPGLVLDTAAIVRAADPAKDGDLIEAGVAALWSTPLGRKQVISMKQVRSLEGFIVRQQALLDH